MKGAGGIGAGDYQTTTILKVPSIQDLLKDLPCEAGFAATDAHIVDQQHLYAHEPVDRLLLVFRRLHSQFTDELERSDHQDGRVPSEAPAKSSHGKMGFANAASAPQVQVVVIGVETPCGIERSLVSGRYLKSVEGKFPVWSRPADQRDETLSERSNAFLALPREFRQGCTRRTLTVQQTAAPDAGAGQDTAAQRHGWHPFPRQVLRARAAPIDLEKRRH
jgi:hypothetical protein